MLVCSKRPHRERTGNQHAVVPRFKAFVTSGPMRYCREMMEGTAARLGVRHGQQPSRPSPARRLRLKLLGQVFLDCRNMMEAGPPESDGRRKNPEAHPAFDGTLGHIKHLRQLTLASEFAEKI